MTDRKLRIAIAIPTYNRLDRLVVALAHVESQAMDERVDLCCVISNIASNDGTTEFLAQLDSSRVRYIIHNQPEDNVNLNWRRCVEAIPADVDWVWFHGDDDFITIPEAVGGVAEIIDRLADDRLSVVHVTQARRSHNSGQLRKGTLFDLCNELGFHEVLGWMSSLVVRRDRFVPAILRSTESVIGAYRAEDLIERRISAFAHSSALLEACIGDQACVVDVPWVEPQDAEQTPESIARWQEGGVSERYFFVIDDLLDMQSRGVLPAKLTRTFFRYLTYSLWDRYAGTLIAAAIRARTVTAGDQAHWDRIARIAELLADPAESKTYTLWVSATRLLVEQFATQAAVLAATEAGLRGQLIGADAPSYDFKLLAEGAACAAPG